jgi:hypothetical protein
MDGKTFASSWGGIDKKLVKLASVFALLGSFALAFCFWIQRNRVALPSVTSKAGKALLRQYQSVTHDIWLILLMVAISWLVFKVYISRRKERNSQKQLRKDFLERLLGFVKNNLVVSILFVAYAFAMVAGTTYLYKDMIGWYPGLLEGHLLDNFSIKSSFVKETMRRTDYRFFPLAHQDLHVLSWFTVNIKTWMLFNVAELVGIVLLCMNFLNSFKRDASTEQSTLLLLTVLFLIHPSTGVTFFHVIYCERILCLVFALYITSYINYKNTQNNSSFYLTLLWALIGIYVKDIAVVLFVVPPACLWAAGTIAAQGKKISNSFILEKCLCCLAPIFATSYIILAFVPSTFAADQAYNKDAIHGIFLDLRMVAFLIICLIRAGMIFNRRINFSILDAINVAAFAYGISLVLTYSFNASDYLSLPVQMVAAINIGWAWICFIESLDLRMLEAAKKNLMAISILFVAILTEHVLLAGASFAKAVTKVKSEQNYIQSVYSRLFDVSREIRGSGADVVILIEKSSRFSAYRHLSRIPYRSLVEYSSSKFIVSDGVNKGQEYHPKVGDIIVNFGSSGLHEISSSSIKKLELEVLYKHNLQRGNGNIFRIASILFK